MKKGEWEDMPDSWHCINCAGSIVMVSSDVRKEVEAWLRHLEYPRDHFATIVVDTVLGETMTLIADAINVIYETTPEIRAKNREIDARMKEECLEQGFPEE